jgi:hypothetical protein
MYPNYLLPYLGHHAQPYSYPYPYYGGYGNVYGNYTTSNIIGSAIANQSLINTGNMFGVNQIATPTVIW